MQVFADGGLSYKPAAGFVGTDSFRYQLDGGLLGSNYAVVTINVTNTAPEGVQDSYTSRGDE